MPNAVCELLAKAPIKDLGVHTEMFVDSLVSLYEAGKVTGAHKATNRYQMTYMLRRRIEAHVRFSRSQSGVLRGSGRLHQPAASHHAERSASSRSATPRKSISPGRRAPSRPACGRSAAPAASSNSCAALTPRAGGKAFLCLASTYERGARRASRIVARIDDSNIVTTPRTDVMYVVTEYGIVNLKGKSVPERARALISIAHPEFREELERQAREYRLISRAIF